MLQKYGPQIRALYGNDPWTAYQVGEWQQCAVSSDIAVMPSLHGEQLPAGKRVDSTSVGQRKWRRSAHLGRRPHRPAFLLAGWHRWQACEMAGHLVHGLPSGTRASDVSLTYVDSAIAARLVRQRLGSACMHHLQHSLCVLPPLPRRSSASSRCSFHANELPHPLGRQCLPDARV